MLGSEVSSSDMVSSRLARPQAGTMMAPSSAMQRYSRRPNAKRRERRQPAAGRQPGARGGAIADLACKQTTHGGPAQRAKGLSYKNDYVPEEGLTAAGRALVPVEHP